MPTPEVKTQTDPKVADFVRRLRTHKREDRAFPGQELRADVEKRQILGFVPYNSASTLIGGWFIEYIEPTAFARALNGEQDPRGYWGHSRLHVLGRFSNDTLRLKDSSKGLHYEIDAPGGDWADSLLDSINRGDVDESSFGFVLDHSQGDRWEVDEKTGARKRYLVDVVLKDLSPVAEAAYPESKVSARSILLANEIDPEQLAEALEISHEKGISDPEVRQIILNASSVLNQLMGASTETATPTAEEPAAQPDDEAQARSDASVLDIYRRRIQLLDMEVNHA